MRGLILGSLLLFGAGKVSDLGKGLGEGIRNFKKGLREDEATETDHREAYQKCAPATQDGTSDPDAPTVSRKAG